MKRTGPAEPAINLCASLKEMGLEVSFACCSFSTHKVPAVPNFARQRGIEPIGDLNLTKHFNVVRNLQDCFRLAGCIERNKIDLVHAHLNNDHLVGGLAARRSGRPVKIVRSCYDGGGFPRSLRERYLLGNLTDGLIVAGNELKNVIRSRTEFPEERLWVVPGAVDLDRFNPHRPLPDMRPQFRLAPSDFVVGIVARMQPHRRFDVLLEAMKIVSRSDPTVKLLILGRGSKMQKVAVQPVKRMGLEGCVIFGGYQREEAYVAALACIDAKIFLVPGSDGTCRAVREAMAMGKPVVAARRGMLPEIVRHAVDGFIIDDTPVNIAEAVLYLGQNREKTREMGAEAFKKAQQVYNLPDQARAVANIYQAILEGHSYGS